MTHIDNTLLNEYLDEQLETAVLERVEAHLAACASCRERLAGEKQLFAELAELPEIPLTVDLSPSVMARISAEIRPRPLPRWTVPIITLQMAAAAALFIWLWPSALPLLETAGQFLSQTAGQWLSDFSLSETVSPLFEEMDRLGQIGEVIKPDSPLPILEGFLIISLALILWLAGSGLILSQSLILKKES